MAGSGAIESVVADPGEALRQHVLEEPRQELLAVSSSFALSGGLLNNVHEGPHQVSATPVMPGGRQNPGAHALTP